jgi:hypothetical protein
MTNAETRDISAVDGCGYVRFPLESAPHLMRDVGADYFPSRSFFNERGDVVAASGVSMRGQFLMNLVFRETRHE